jgi:biotin synthase
MEKKDYLSFAESIVKGASPEREKYEGLIDVPRGKIFDMLAGADMIREANFKKSIHLCTICNAKSGKCSEDCSFCSQSSIADTDAPVYPLISKTRMQDGSIDAVKSGINRYSIVTSGKRLPKKEISSVAEAIRGMDSKGLGICCSLGIIDKDDLALLKEAGMTRYHHNLEASESFFPRICTTHSYKERVDTILAARELGLSLCVGGLFGMGETDEQVLELAMAIRELNVDSVPINFLTPIKGTRLENSMELSPLRCLKIIALFRYVLPDKDILICGGREENLGELHPFVFYAGASGLMTGNYLTTKGRTYRQDRKMIEDLGFSVREPLITQSLKPGLPA